MRLGDFLRRDRSAPRQAEPVELGDLPAWAGGTGFYHQVARVWDGLDLKGAPADAGTPVEGAPPLPRRPQ